MFQRPIPSEFWAGLVIMILVFSSVIGYSIYEHWGYTETFLEKHINQNRTKLWPSRVRTESKPKPIPPDPLKAEAF